MRNEYKLWIYANWILPSRWFILTVHTLTQKIVGIYLNIWDQIYLDCAHILFGPMVFIFLLNLQKKLFAPVSVLFPYYILSTLVSHTKDVGMTIERCWSSLWWWCQQIKVLSFSFVNASSLRRTNFPLFCSGQWSMLMHNISVKKSINFGQVEAALDKKMWWSVSHSGLLRLKLEHDLLSRLAL